MANDQILVRTPLYVPRIRVWGTIHWICPYSAHFNATRLTPTHYRLACDPGSCGRKFIPGFILYPVPLGRGVKSALPPDWVIPSDYEQPSGLRDAFPAGDLSSVPWRRHDSTHVLVDPNGPGGDFNVGLLVKTVRALAAGGQDKDFEASGIGQAPRSRLARLGAAFEAVANGYGL